MNELKKKAQEIRKEIQEVKSKMGGGEGAGEQAGETDGERVRASPFTVRIQKNPSRGADGFFVL